MEVVNEIPILPRQIPALIKRDAEKNGRGIGLTIEVVVPASNNHNIIKMKKDKSILSTSGGLVSVSHKKIFRIHNDFYSYKGVTKEAADSYLDTFNKFYVKVAKSSAMFSIYYRTTRWQ